MRAFLAVAVGALCLTAAGSALADEPTRPERFDPGEYPPPEARVNMLIAGAGITAGWYGAAVGFSYLWPGAPGAKDLRLPVVGPWMALADTGCADDNPGCSTFGVVLRAILTTMDAVGQAGGVAVMVEAALLPTQERAPRPSLPPLRLRRESSQLQVRPVPFTAGQDGLGLGIVGSF